MGTDIYHDTQDQLTGVEIAFGGDEMRSLKGENYLVLETQAQAFKEWLPYPGQLRLQAYSHIASGACGVMYWNWHSIHNSYETYWKGLLSHDLSWNQTVKEAGVVGNELKRLNQNLVGLHKKNKVAILVDNESLSSFQWFPIDKDLSYNDVLLWMYESLYERNIECDVIYADRGDFKDYQVIVMPAMYCVSEQLLKELKQFAADGGTLISSFKTAVADDQVKVYSDTQPHQLSECFGISYNQFTCPNNVTVDGEEVSYWMELLQPSTAETMASYEHQYWGSYAAITRNEYQKGRAYYIGCYTTKTALQKVYQDAFEKAGLLSGENSFQWPVIIRNGINAKNEHLHFVFHYSSNHTKIICIYEKVIDILTGNEYRKNDEITLKDWDMGYLDSKRNLKLGGFVRWIK